MKTLSRAGLIALGLAALPAAAIGWTMPGAAPGKAEAAAAAPTAGHIVSLRRITEAQYRNTISDIFGPDIRVAGRFEPIVRPVHELIASGASDAAISPTGLENFDSMARVIAAQVFDERHRDQFMPCKPADVAQADNACAAATLAPLGRYLFRRPLSQQEQAFFVGLAGDAAAKSGSFYKGMELSVAAILVSPNFLYVVERSEPDPAVSGGQRLDNYSRAARLAMFLWNSAPNEALLQAAERGDLTNQAKLNAVATQMVNSARFEQGIRAFFTDMLLFEKFDDIAKDPIIYPAFSPEVAQALPEQTLRTIVDHLLTRDGDYRQLFTTNRTFMTRVLGPLYQVQVPRSQGWVPYDFAPTDDRAGLLGQAGFLSLYSHPGRSSPTLRGRAIREVLMCQNVPNPPGNVNFTAVQEVHNKALPTARVRLSQHNTNPVCAGCHRLTDPVGLSLEKFDGIGAYRMTENDAPIDVSGKMNGADFHGGSGLGAVLAASPAVTSCVASRALEYAYGHKTEDTQLLEGLNKGFAAGKYKIRSLFLQVATMPETWRVRAPSAITPTQVSLAGPHSAASR